MPARRGRGTRTSSFGSTGRFGHDSTTFYAGRLYDGLRPEKAVPYVENPIPAETLDTVICGSSERMAELPDNSVHLMVTSPPYNVGKDYDEDLTLEEYTDFLKRVMSEVYRALVPGGRACVNVANLGRRPYLPLHSLIIQDMIEVGFLMRGEVIWDKGGSAGRSTAWGSWLSPSNPTLRDVHEYILIFCKDTFSRPQVEGRTATITRDQFLEYTKSVWNFPSESAAKVGHPAPFPVELPHRCVQLYSYTEEVVLDPFLGSGSTAVAASMAQRHFVGYEIQESYCQAAERRLAGVQGLGDQAGDPVGAIEAAVNGVKAGSVSIT